MRFNFDDSANPAQHRNTPTAPGTGNRNALKHGFYSAAILLPGEDAEAFHRERVALFEMFRPQTIREAQLLDGMAEWQWQLDRSSPLQARCDEQALEPAADAAGRIGEPLAHRRLHTTMDVTVHRQRLDRAVHRNEHELIKLQKLRRMGLIEGAVKLPPGCYMERTGAVVGPVLPQGGGIPGAPAPEAPAPETLAPAVPAPEAPAPEARQETRRAVTASENLPATGSDDGANSKTQEPKENVNEPGQAAPGPRLRAARRQPDSRGRLLGGVGLRRIWASPLRPPAPSADTVDVSPVPRPV